jgi:hypothetical protein
VVEIKEEASMPVPPFQFVGKHSHTSHLEPGPILEALLNLF